MIKGGIFDLDDTLTIHEDLYNKNYLAFRKSKSHPLSACKICSL